VRPAEAVVSGSGWGFCGKRAASTKLRIPASG
jgi:hypothetical protein